MHNIGDTPSVGNSGGTDTPIGGAARRSGEARSVRGRANQEVEVRPGVGAEAGRPTAEWVEALYAELRALAGRYLSGERLDHTLQPTAVLHEAFVRLSVSGQSVFNDRRHFFSSASAVMRHVLVDHARRKRSEKRGGRQVKLALSDLSAGLEPTQEGQREPLIDVIELDGALTKLAAISPVTADLVQLRFFAGMSVSEACAALGLSEADGRKEWRFARAWLFKELSISEGVPPSRGDERSGEVA